MTRCCDRRAGIASEMSVSSASLAEADSDTCTSGFVPACVRNLPPPPSPVAATQARHDALGLCGRTTAAISGRTPSTRPLSVRDGNIYTCKALGLHSKQDGDEQKNAEGPDQAGYDRGKRVGDKRAVVGT